jgi:hypothetical protein
MDRRTFMLGSGAFASLALSSRQVFSEELADISRSQLSQRVAEIIEEYSAQGIHRTGTTVDNQSGQWLAHRIAELGVKPELERFEFERVQPMNNSLTIGDQTFEGVPLYDCTYTDANGITGRVGALGSDAEIGMLQVRPVGSAPEVRELHAAREQGLHKAFIAVTTPLLPAGGVAPLNAEDFIRPFGPPVLQLASDSWDALQRAAQNRVPVKLTVHCERVTSEAMNVAARIEGRDSSLAPLVIMTPRSGWWRNASERGGGIACFLEMMRAIKQAGPARDVLFTANTGHELGHVGLDRYLQRNHALIKEARLWIHLGANFAAAYGSSVRLQYSDRALQDLTQEHLIRADVKAAEETPIEQRPLGEARNIFDGGGRYISVLGNNGLFHHPLDTWPESVNLALISKWTRVFAGLGVALSR